MLALKKKWPDFKMGILMKKIVHLLILPEKHKSKSFFSLSMLRAFLFSLWAREPGFVLFRLEQTRVETVVYEVWLAPPAK